MLGPSGVPFKANISADEGVRSVGFILIFKRHLLSWALLWDIYTVEFCYGFNSKGHLNMYAWSVNSLIFWPATHGLSSV